MIQSTEAILYAMKDFFIYLFSITFSFFLCTIHKHRLTHPLSTVLSPPPTPSQRKRKSRKKRLFDRSKGLSQCEYNTTAWRCLINKLIRLSSSPFSFCQKKSNQRKKNDTTLVLKLTSLCPLLRFSSSISMIRSSVSSQCLVSGKV